MRTTLFLTVTSFTRLDFLRVTLVISMTQGVDSLSKSFTCEITSDTAAHTERTAQSILSKKYISTVFNLDIDVSIRHQVFHDKDYHL